MCWEVFSLGKNPYPGVDPFSLIRYLERGERLDKPLMQPAPRKCEFEPPRLSTVINTVLSIMICRYDMMKECWDGGRAMEETLILSTGHSHLH